VKTYLNVPFAEKDHARRLGAQWNDARKTWFVEDIENLRPFLRWMPKHLTQPTTATPPKKIKHKKNKQRRKA
jgi:hypothetical protein